MVASIKKIGKGANLMNYYASGKSVDKQAGPQYLGAIFTDFTSRPTDGSVKSQLAIAKANAEIDALNLCIHQALQNGFIDHNGHVHTVVPNRLTREDGKVVEFSFPK